MYLNDFDRAMLMISVPMAKKIMTKGKAAPVQRMMFDEAQMMKTIAIRIGEAL